MCCIKLLDHGKLETRDDTCIAKSTNIKIIDVKADLKNVLVDWLDGWDHGKASDKITVQIGQGRGETVPETDENNSLQVERQVTL